MTQDYAYQAPRQAQQKVMQKFNTTEFEHVELGLEKKLSKFQQPDQIEEEEEK